MNQEQRKKLYQKGFDDGVEAVEEMVVKATYAAAALAAKHLHRFGPDRCVKLLTEMDRIIVESFTSAELIDQALKEIGVKIVFRDPVPIRKLEEGEEP
jgi:hypothetical protein